mmetsp:Transcript_27315/g.69360  ORF Transcript_27315/g.69360 Transcript_27315/m.69360 type:complete len:264 (-) Transcript_27315:2854-3645(-)
MRALLLRQRPRAFPGQQAAEHGALRLRGHGGGGAESGQELDHRGQGRHRHVREARGRHRVLPQRPLHGAQRAAEQAVPHEPLLGGYYHDPVWLRGPDPLHPVRGGVPAFRHGDRGVHVLLHRRQRVAAHQRAAGPLRARQRGARQPLALHGGGGDQQGPEEQVSPLLPEASHVAYAPDASRHPGAPAGAHLGDQASDLQARSVPPRQREARRVPLRPPARGPQARDARQATLQDEDSGDCPHGDALGGGGPPPRHRFRLVRDP